MIRSIQSVKIVGWNWKIYKSKAFSASQLGNERKAKMATVGNAREVDINGNDNSLEIEEIARYAVQEHNNKENALLEFGKVLRVTKKVVSGTLYDVKFEATDGGQKKVYEAKVWVKPWESFKELQEFKLVGGSDTA